jgi:uncharacterized protein YcnI
MRRLASIGSGLAVALVSVGVAAAHPALSPGSIEAGVATPIVAQVPNERRGHATTGVTLGFGKGFTVVKAAQVGSWSPRSETTDAAWRGGRISGSDQVDFPLTVEANVPAGSYDVTLLQAYDDGRSVTTKTQILVLPAAGENAPSEHPGRAIIAAIAGILVVGGSLVGLRALRRRPGAK